MWKIKNTCSATTSRKICVLGVTSPFESKYYSMINFINSFLNEISLKYCLLSADKIQKLAMKRAGTATLLSLGTGTKAGIGDLWIVLLGDLWIVLSVCQCPDTQISVQCFGFCFFFFFFLPRLWKTRYGTCCTKQTRLQRRTKKRVRFMMPWQRPLGMHGMPSSLC